MNLLAVQGTLKILQHHSSKASVLQRLAFFIVQLTSIKVWCDSSTGGKREKRKGESEEMKGIPLFQRNTPTLVPLHTPPSRMLGEGWGRETQGRESPSSAHSQGYWDVVHIFAKTVGSLCQKDWPNSLGKRPAQLVAMKVVPGDQRTGPGGEPGGHKGDKETRHESGPGVPLTFSRGRKTTFCLPRPTLKDTKGGTLPL